MPSHTFTGAEFHLESVVQYALATVRVTYTQLPLILSSSGPNDALNPANYTLLGTSVNSIVSIGPVYGNPQQVDLFLSAPLTAGAWTLTVAPNVEMVDTTTILNPRVMTFNVALSATIPPVPNGATNDTDAQIIRKHLNPALVGKGWDAVIAAIATGETTNRVNAQLAYDQLFTSTSSGLYLARHAGDIGLTKPVDVGMSDALFRKYVIDINADKVTYEALLNILEIFYGESSVRASATSAASEPFFIQNGDDLTVLVDEHESVYTVFSDDDFAITGQALAAEVAAALTRSLEINGTTAYAVPFKDPTTGLNKVAIYSGSTGLGSAIRVTSGKAQNALLFPEQLILTTSLFPTWTVTRVPGKDQFQFTSYQAAGTTDLNLRLLQVGDYVNIFGNEFNSLNHGSFPVLDVYYAPDLVGSNITQYFVVPNIDGFAESGIVQTGQFDINYFRPVKQSIYNVNQSSAILIQSGNGFTVDLPATSSAVNRTEYSAAYCQTNTPITITSMVRDQQGVITIVAPSHGLLPATGSPPVLPTQQVIIDGAYFSVTAPTIIPGSGSGHAGTAAQSIATIVSPLLPTVGTGTESQVTLTLPSGQGLLVGGFNYNASVITLRNNIELFTISSINPVVYAWSNSGVTLPVPAAFMAGSIGNANLPAIDGDAILTGGSDVVSTSYANAYSYDPIAATLSILASMHSPRAGHAQTTLSTGDVLVTGGVGSTWNQSIAGTEQYNGIIWTIVASMNQDRIQHGQVELQDGSILVTGGRTVSVANSGQLLPATSANYGIALNRCERRVSGTWNIVGQMGLARFSHATVLLPNGQVVVIGGLGYNVSQAISTSVPMPLSAVEIFDPSTNRWRLLGNSLNAHGVTWAELLTDTNEIIFGSAESASIEKLDLNTFKFSVVTSVASPSLGAQSALLEDDIILIAGGRNGTQSTSVNGLFIPDAEVFAEGGLNGFFQVQSVIDANTFTINTPDYAVYTVNASTTATVTLVAAAAGDIAGPFIWDTTGGVAITGTESTLVGNLAAGRGYGQLNVVDATVFPDQPGYLVLNFGYNGQVGPIQYFGKLSNTALVLDDSFIFPSSVTSGVTVTLLDGKAPYVPVNPQSYGSFYITDSPSGRVACEAAVLANSAAGVDIDVNIIYPSGIGMGAYGFPTKNNYKVSDVVEVWSGNDIDAEVAAAEGRTTNGGQ